MKHVGKSSAPVALVLPLVLSLLIICVAAGYFVCRVLRERAYREKWKDYNDCGFA